MNERIDLNEILRNFDIKAIIRDYGNGNINDTYLTETKDYILQKINTNIFKKPHEVMENIDNVTSFLRKKIEQRGGNPDRETVTVIKTHSGENFFKVDDNNVFRVYKFIDDTITIEQCTSPDDLYYAGKGFGRFQSMLHEFPVEKLYETIEDFHNTPKRVEALKKAILEDRAGRAKDVNKEIEFALSNASFAGKVVEEMNKGNIPVRVTHNDTKINNILFDKNTREAICVIDLDTVMPGSALYDFGDALRVGASTAAEDEVNLDAVHFSKQYFESFAKGFFEEMGNELTEMEIELLPFSAKLLTYECGIRFLTDYLNGDTYFKTKHKNHNLDRARNQFKLVEEISEMENELNLIVKGLR